MVNLVAKVSLLVLLFFVAACPGLKFLKLLGIKKDSLLMLFVLSAACGFTIIAEGLLALGLLGLFSPLVMCFFIVALFLVSATEARFFLEGLIRYCTSLSCKRSAQHTLVVIFGIFVLINVLKSLLPPHGPTDVLYYHLTLPRLFLANQAILTVATFFPSFFPPNGELLFSLGFVLGGPSFANLLHFGFALLTVAALYAFAQQYIAGDYAIIPGIIYLTAPVINSWGTMAYTDNMLGFYLLLLCMLLLDSEKQDQGTGMVCGLITGMALGIKYQAIPWVGLIYLFFFVYHWRKRRLVYPSLILSLIIGMVLVSPWLIRNAMVTGNPVFPILRDIFPSDLIRPGAVWGIDTEAGESIHKALRNLIENPLSPFAYLVSGAWDKDDFQRFIGPLFLGFFPFVLFLKRTHVKWPLIWLVCLFSYLAALILRGNLRYAIVLIALLSLLCGAVGQELLAAARRGERALGVALLSLVILLYSVQNYQLMLSLDRVLTSLNPRLTPSFLRAFEPSYRAAEFANQNIPADAKVLFHGLARYFYFKFDPLNDHLSQTWITYDKARNGEDILRIMRSHGITHIICQDVIPGTAQPNTILYDKDPRFVEFTGKYLQKLFTSNSISIYRIR